MIFSIDTVCKELRWEYGYTKKTVWIMPFVIWAIRPNKGLTPWAPRWHNAAAIRKEPLTM